MALSTGTRLGPYEVTAQLGVGGMGEVYRATDTNLKRAVALKVLPESVASDAERLARFQREAEVLAALNHPNIAAIYGVERSSATTALVMELVEGPTLAERIARGAIAIDEALPIAKQIADALEAAHEQGIIHRDLKPANIKVRDDGVVKVLDFGLAKALAQDPRTSGPQDLSASPTITSPALMTGVGVILGTAAYMSPEQARGKAVDKRSDIWAFGAVLFEMLTGRRAFDDEDVSMTLSKVLQRDPDFDALPSTVPARITQTLRVCLRKDAKQRIGDIRDVRLALDGVFETAAPQHARSVAIANPIWHRALPAAAAALVTLLVAGLAAWSWWPSGEPQAANRFGYDLPPDQVFPPSGRPVIAVSPDGRRFVYATRTGLYLRPMGALEAVLIPGTEDGGMSNPFFAPDGQSVGYFQNGQLKRIGLNGGAAIVICASENDFGASWGKDDTILFGHLKGIMRVSANGGTPELVIPAKAGEQINGVQLLPDGDSVLFSVTTATGQTRWDAAQIVVQSLSTRERRVVLQGGNGARYVPTGHLIYALGDRLLAIAFDVGRLEVAGGPVSVVEGVGRGGNPTVSSTTAQFAVADAGTLVYARPNPADFGDAGGLPPVSLVWVDRDGKEEPLAAEPRVYTYPRLSPDGTRVALDVRTPDGGDIWIWDLRRQVLTRVSSDPGQDILPVWTPDGQRLVWASPRAGRYNLYWQAADGTGAVERLTESPSPQRASSFTPDGRRLVLAQDEPPPSRARDIFLLPLDGDRRATPLVQTKFDERNGEISPDGRWLAYESNESGQFEIYVRPFPAVNGGRSQISTGGGRQALWARNGRELFYLAPDGSLMLVPVNAQSSASFAAGTPVTLMAGAGYNYSVGAQSGRSYDVSLDGKRFLRIKPSGPSVTRGGHPDLVIVTNWFEELKRLMPTK